MGVSKKAAWMGLAVMAAAGALLAGFGSEHMAAKKLTIGLIPKAAENPVFQAARSGAMDAAKELGSKYGVEVNVIWAPPNKEDAQEQAKTIQKLIGQGVNAISLSVSDANVLNVEIDNAVAKGVQVMCFDSDAPKSKRFAFYGTDDMECGQLIMKQLATAMGDKGVVAILAGNQSAPNLQARVQGVMKEAANHKDIKVIGTYYHTETAQDAVKKVEEVQAANPQITGWAMVGGWPLFTEKALDKVKAKVVAVDALPAELNYLENGQVAVLLGQKCYGWGYESVRMILEKVVNKKDPEGGPVVKAPLDVVTKDNASKYREQWTTWLGKKEGAKESGKK